jgi:hypothetical protein
VHETATFLLLNAIFSKPTPSSWLQSLVLHSEVNQNHEVECDLDRGNLVGVESRGICRWSTRKHTKVVTGSCSHDFCENLVVCMNDFKTLTDSLFLSLYP